MPETLSIGKKKLNKNVVYVGGAAALGFVGYAWFTKGRADSTASDVPVDDTSPVEEPTDIPGFGVSSPDNAQARPNNNADWSELAIQRMINIGHDPLPVSAALGKFLAHKALNAVEAGLVQEAIRAAGYPPEGGPWSVIAEPLPMPVAGETAPGPVRNLMASASRTQMLARWSSPNTGGKAVRYKVEFFGGRPGGGTYVVSTVTVSGNEAKSQPVLKPDTPYNVRVTAYTANGKAGPTVTHNGSVRTMK